MNASHAVPPLRLRAVGPFELSHEREARLAARRVFVHLKQCFIEAVADVPGALGDSLRYKVQQTTEVVELWQLRRAVLAALPPTERQRAALRVRLDAAFPQRCDDDTAFVAL